ncbi:MAG: NAD-dependent epimerase/dehydratase family protein [Pseudolabrys sp.]
MLEHLNAQPQKPKRVVVLGAGGFVGGYSARALQARGVEVRALARSDLDLLAADAGAKLKALLRPGDSLLVVSARAPVKNVAMLGENIRMMEAVCAGIDGVALHHVVYISSDAVYRDSAGPLTEASCAEPGSLHGAMHLARELMLKSVVTAPFAALRPSLLYGPGDPHNGYGPNRFARLAAEGKAIVLFGEGEERRDHVFIEDVAELVCRVLLHRSRGILNIATGEVTSFRAIAESVVRNAKTKVPVNGSPRQGPMPHNGYRPFDAAATRKAFPDFRYTPIAEGLARLPG